MPAAVLTRDLFRAFSHSLVTTDRSPYNVKMALSDCIWLLLLDILASRFSSGSHKSAILCNTGFLLILMSEFHQMFWSSIASFPVMVGLQLALYQWSRLSTHILFLSRVMALSISKALILIKIRF